MPYANKEDMYANQAKHRARNRQNLIDYLSNKSCIDCGEDDIRCLDFDHRDPEDKKFTVGKAVGGSTRSWKSILKEINKCDIRCANCHRKRTHKQLGYWSEQQ